MNPQPTIETQRLRLRPLRPDDARRVQELAGAYEVALNTLHIPHPYPDGVAETWITASAERFDNHTAANFAIALRDDDQLIGAVGLVTKEFDRAELGYWIGVPHWGRGYASEAAQAMVGFAFEQWGVNRLEAYHFTRNPASGRVLQKIGMRHEGCQRGAVKKWDEYLDIEMYAILRKDL